MQNRIDPILQVQKPLLVEKDGSIGSKRQSKVSFNYHMKNCQTERSRRPRISISHALTWQRKTPTAAAEKTRSATGVRTASVRSRQLSASSPASSRASRGARICERWRGGRRIFDHHVMGIYKERDGTTQLRRCPWRFTSEGHVASMQHLGSCSMFPRTPDCPGDRSEFSGFQAIRIQH